MLSVRIVILNYNGREILPKCLPSLVDAAKKASYPTKVSILDNRSPDQSAEWAKKEFPEIDVTAAPENLFLVSFNGYLKQIPEDIVILLNNDIRVNSYFIDPLIKPFEKNPDLFMACPQTLSFDGSRYEGGRTRARIRWGLFWSSAIFPRYKFLTQKAGNTFASGFGAFDRKKFIALGGYDDLYLPGILEDADLGFRAWQQGFVSLYIPDSKVFHWGQASFKKAFGSKGIRRLAHRNTFLFMWKNLSDATLWLEHLLLLIPRLFFSLFTGSIELVAGFFQALPQLPKALKKRKIPAKRSRSDRELFNLASDRPGVRRYIFKKRWKRFAAGFFDFFGSLLSTSKKIENPDEIKKILAVRIDSMGDGVLTLPAIGALYRRFPNVQIDFLVSANVEPLFSLYFPTSKIFLMKELNWKECRALAGQMKELHYDLAVDFRGDMRTLFLMRFAKIPHRWGRTGTGGGFLLTKKGGRYAGHEALKNIHLVQNGSLNKAEFPPLPHVSKAFLKASEWLKAACGKKKIVIHMGAGYPSKRWRAANFAELVKRILDRGLGIPLLIGSVEEKKLFEPYQRSLSGVMNLIGCTSLTELMGLLKEADLFIGNDSGPAHLASALGCKQVVIFSGTNDFRQWAPWSSFSRIINHPVPCSPCEEKICPLSRQICLEEISVEDVMQEVEAALHD